MQESKREFIKQIGLIGAAGMFAVMPSASGDQLQAGANSSSVFNVKDFGAKGDGRASDSAAIQRALDEAGKVQGTAYFPSGNYRCHDLKVHSHTTVLAEPQWAYGSDAGAVLTIDSEEADGVLDVTDGCGCHIRGIFLRGNKRAAKVQHGIFQNNDSWNSFENTPVLEEVSVNSFSGNGVYLKKIKLFIIRHSIFQDNKDHGVCVQEGRGGLVIDNHFSGNGKCGFATEISGATVMFTANSVEWNGEYGLYLIGDAENQGKAWNVTGNCFDRNGGAAIFANGISDSTFTGNAFLRNGRNAANLTEGTPESCHVLIQACKGITVTGNTGVAGRDDDGQGALTPNNAFRLENNVCCIVTANTFSEGYLNDMVLNKGGNQDVEIINNIGSVYK